MKFFVCLSALLAVANAGFSSPGGFGGGPSGFGGGGGGGPSGFGGGGGPSGFGGGGGGHGYRGSNGLGAPAQIFKVKFINEGPGPGPDVGPAPQVVRVIHQQSAQQSAPQVVKVIHQYEPGPASAAEPTEVIKVIHENRGPLPGANSALQPQASAPAKVIRVIHENAQPQASATTGSFSNPVAPDNGYLPPLQASASNQYLPPPADFSAPAPSFSAPEPVHVPATSYGPTY